MIVCIKGFTIIFGNYKYVKLNISGTVITMIIIYLIYYVINWSKTALTIYIFHHHNTHRFDRIKLYLLRKTLLILPNGCSRQSHNSSMGTFINFSLSLLLNRDESLCNTSLKPYLLTSYFAQTLRGFLI